MRCHKTGSGATVVGCASVLTLARAVSPSAKRRDLDAQNVRARVVADGVEPLALRKEQVGVELRVEDSLLVPDGAREVLAVRADDGRAAAAEEVGAVCDRHVGRVARGALVDAARE